MASEENIQLVLTSTASEITRDEIIKALEDNSGNVVDAIVSLWNIKNTEKSLNKTQAVFKDIRETCDSYDKQMENVVISNKNKKLLKETLME
jgi:hypothetical protein